MRIKNILENLSWIPFNRLMKRKNTDKKFILLDLNKIGINKKFKFFILDKDKGLSSHLKVFGFREPLHYKYYYEFISKNDVVLDIGSNLGLFTLLSSNAKKIICVEPLKEVIEIWEKNMEINKINKKTFLVNCAVGSKNGKLTIYINKEINMSKIVSPSFVNKNPEKKMRDVKSKELNWFEEKYNPNVLRMDLEGFEYEVLYKKIPKGIEKIDLEFHVNEMGKEKVLKLMKYFEEENFKINFLIEDIPLRIYPFYIFLRKIGLRRFFGYVKKDLNPQDAIKYLFKGRGLKYLILERKK